MKTVKAIRRALLVALIGGSLWALSPVMDWNNSALPDWNRLSQRGGDDIVRAELAVITIVGIAFVLAELAKREDVAS